MAAGAIDRLHRRLERARADADVIVEAVFENLDVKREVFRKLDGIAKPEAILATNTSTLDVDALAAATTRPGKVVGLHFFVPANIMPLLEIVRGEQTSPQTIATAFALGKTAAKEGRAFGQRVRLHRQPDDLRLRRAKRWRWPKKARRRRASTR